VKPYIAVLSARFRTLLQYRTAALAGVGTQLFFGYIRMMIFTAFYRSSSAAQPMNLAQVIDYIWLGQALLMLAMFTVEGDIAAMIRSGAVAYELTRPIDLYGLWYSRCVSARTAPLILRALPIVIVAGLFFGLRAPASIEAGVLFAVSILLSVLLASAMTALITISLMWTVSGEGIVRTAPAMIMFFSGMVIPLPLFPQWAQPVVKSLPFRGLTDVPFRIYTGNMNPSEIAVGVLQQAGWTVALILIGRWAVARGVRSLVVQGG
jgi:ABC-2 type transport system permease protein